MPTAEEASSSESSSPPEPQDRLVPKEEAVFDLQGYIEEEVSKGKKTIVIPAAVYRLKPSHGHHILLEGLDGVTIQGEEVIVSSEPGSSTGPNTTTVELICTETTRAITLRNCHNCTLQGLTIDYDPLPYTTGRIVGFGDKPWTKLTHEIELVGGYLSNRSIENDNNSNYEIYTSHYLYGDDDDENNNTNTNTSELRYGSYEGYRLTIDPRSPGRCTIQLPDRYQNDLEFRTIQHSVQIGDIVVLGASHTPSSSSSSGGKKASVVPHAVCALDCTNITYDNITVYASTKFGFFEKACASTQYRHCTIDRRASPHDRKPRAVPRMRSTNADAFHSACAIKKGPTLEGCVAQYMGDDGVNICGHYHLITNVLQVQHHKEEDPETGLAAYCSVTLRVLTRSTDGTINIAVQDPIELMTCTNGCYEQHPIVTEIVPDGTITEEEKILLADQKLCQHLKTNRGGAFSTAYQITVRFRVHDDNRTTTLTEPRIRATIHFGAALAAVTKQGDHFSITKCTFGSTRSRGVTIKASHGTITGNTFRKNWGEAVRMAPGYPYWMESGTSRDITIANNSIDQCASHAIAVYAFQGDNRTLVPSTKGHQNISITNNTIRNSPVLPNILMTSTNKYTIQNNDCNNDGTNCESIAMMSPPILKKNIKEYIQNSPNQNLENNTIVTINCCGNTNAK